MFNNENTPFCEISDLANLKERDKQAIVYRQKDCLGFGQNVLTYKSLGDIYGVSPQRASEIVSMTCRKIKKAIHIFLNTAHCEYINGYNDGLKSAEVLLAENNGIPTIRIGDVEMSTRTENVLRCNNITTLNQLQDLHEHQVNRYSK